MTDELSIIALLKDQNEGKRLSVFLSKQEYQTIILSDRKNFNSLVGKYRPHIVIVELENQITSDLSFVNSMCELSSSTYIILLYDHFNSDFMENILTMGFTFGIIKKPVKKQELLYLLRKYKSRNKIQIEIQNELKELYNSYNYIEFLNTILINNVGNNTDILSDLVNELNNKVSKEKMLNKIKLIQQNNKLLLNRINFMQKIEEYAKGKKIKVELLEIFNNVLEQIEEEESNFITEYCINKSENAYEVFAVKELIEILVYEVLYSFSMPYSQQCKKLEINFRLTNNLKDKDGKAIPTIEFDIISILTKPDTSDEEIIINPTSQQFGFGYCLIKSIMDRLNGVIQLRDEPKEDSIETILTILLPRSV
ncbi:MAG: hypothetical protein ACTSXO_06275 [Candidatus Heimdallarchaeota archaeon]